MEEGRKSVEATGKSVDEAIEKALKELGADREQVEAEVLAEGSRGILGLGRQEARVRVTLTQLAGVVDEWKEVAPVTSGEGDVAAIAAETLRNLLHHMGIEAEVNVRERPTNDLMPVVLDVEGENLGILIGRQGETLRDLQYITCLMVSRSFQHWVNVVVDVGGYKKRRQRVLTELSERMAERVIAEGKPVTLEPMPAHERRIVHMALRNHRSVRTESIDEGARRKVVIMPQ